MEKGYVSLILHTHLPFIKHPAPNRAIEEQWLYEAIHECYLPLVQMFKRLKFDGIPYRVTMSISPTLISMLQDEYFHSGFIGYTNSLLCLAEHELERCVRNPEQHHLVEHYQTRLKAQQQQYSAPSFSLLDEFRCLETSGHLHLITTTATHALLPLMLHNPAAVHAQLQTGMDLFQQVFGHKPNGVWLPECAYYYHLDQILKEFGIRYFISEGVTVTKSLPGVRYSSHAPVTTLSGVSVFPRDAEASGQVWSNTFGYPANPLYREFYRDIGYDLPLEYLDMSLKRKGVRHDTGFKYFRVTGRTDDKQPYDHQKAMDIAAEHGRQFAQSRKEQIEQLSVQMDTPPVITCPFDTELFGHWWYEGPEFLEAFLRESILLTDTYRLISPSDYLEQNPTLECVAPAPGSWGEGGDFSLWLNKSNDWIVRGLYKCRQLMQQQTSRHKDSTDSPLVTRALAQAARELMLAESSDWPFLISRNTSAAYAISRVTSHLSNCEQLLVEISQNRIDELILHQLEQTNNIFPNINYAIYAKK